MLKCTAVGLLLCLNAQGMRRRHLTPLLCDVQADCKAHYFSVYVNSPAFPQPTAAPEMAGVDPLQVRLIRN